jgi:hypothetical protein
MDKLASMTMSDLDIAAAATELAYAVQTVGNASELMPGFRVDRVFDDQWDNTGFYAVAFTNIDMGKVMVAIRGSQDRLDIVSDVTLGVQQYLANRVPLIEYIGMHILANQITIAGHSLGGGLSQYLAYDAALEYPAFRKHIVVQTHNGFGGMAGIAKMHGKFDRKVIEGVTFRNYRHPGDPVSRIGGQAGGIYNIAVHDPRETGLFYAHANARFIGDGKTSPFDGAVKAKDEKFQIGKTIDQLGPELSAALRQIVTNDEPIQAFANISKLVTRLPPKERAHLMALAGDVLPFGRLWRRFFGRK